MKKQKAKVLNATLRKESETFNGYFKYEVEIENEDLTTEKVPAYGKDLQDALSRVVHDRRAEKLLPVVKKIPEIVWVIAWFITFTGIVTYTTTHMELFGEYIGLIYLGVLSLTVSLWLAINNFFTIRNRKK
tara:strand:+ start:349 stop:741 length:393 start_codon:yes stop_codon:yes gene_type:complete